MPNRVTRPPVATVAVAALFAAGLFFVAVDDGSFDVVVRQRWAVVAWWALALALLVGVAPRNTLRPPGLVAVAALALLMVWTAWSFSWGPSDERALIEVARVGAHLACLAIIAGVLPTSLWRAAVAGLTVGAVSVCALALASRLLPGSFDANVVVFGGDAGRLGYPFGYWNALGAWATMTTGLCLAWSAHAPARLWRGAALAVVPMTLTVSYLTYSRASLGGAAVGVLVLLGLSRNRWTLAANAAIAGAVAGGVVLVVRGAPEIANSTGGTGAGRVLLAVLVAGLVAGGGAMLTSRIDSVRLGLRAARITVAATTAIAVLALAGVAATADTDSAWQSFKQSQSERAPGTDPSARLASLQSGRYDIWKEAWKSFEDEPLHGTGAGSYEFTWNQRGVGGFVRDAHSLYLESLAELGVIGLMLVFLFLGAVLAAVVLAVRSATSDAERGAIAGASAAIASYAFGAGVDWLWESTAVTVLAVALAAVVIVASARTWARPPVWLRLLLAGAAILLALVQVPGLVSTSEIRKSQDAVAAGDIPSAREHANQAVDSEPWASSPLVQRALVDERAGDFPAATAELRQAEELDPQNWRIPLLLARIEAKRGDAEEALAAFRRARALRPKGQFFRPR